MSQMSLSNVTASRIHHVGIVVKDLQRTIENYWNILGVGPWAVLPPFGSPAVPDFKCYGKPAWGKCRGALVQVGPLELEMFEALGGVSTFQDWLDEHGEGIQHLKFLVEDLDVSRVEKEMAKQGFPSMQSGHFGGPEYQGYFCYFDTRKPLHTILETSNRSGGTPVGASFYPDNPATESPARVKVTEIKQLGFVVRDVYETAKNYWNILGIGPWEIYEWGSHVLYDRSYHDRPAWGKEKLAHASIGDLELELCQPVEGDSIYQDWINQHGEGFHHMKFLCDDIDEVSNKLIEQGFPSIQSGHFGDPTEKAGGFNYIEIPPLHCIWELVHQPKGLPGEPIAHVP